MYVPIEPRETCAQAWLSTALTVQKLGGEAHNVIVDIADPLTETSTDAAIIREVDAFLRGRNANTLIGVANTIFLKTFSHGTARTGSTEFILTPCCPE